MCGIAGIFRVGCEPGELQTAVGRMVANMQRRGPDGQGIWQQHDLALGHSRLSIIDLSDAASQPMIDDVTGAVIVFNGEIYNYLELREKLIQRGHLFLSQSDTEVLLRAFIEWDTASFDMCIGMWACALYMPRSRRLVLSRDRFGIKPLYFMRRPGELIFASTIAALHAGTGEKPSINPWIVREFLLARSVDAYDQTFFKGIERLPAGCLAELDCRGQKTELRFVRYWDVQRCLEEADSQSPFEIARDEFRNKLEDAIRLHTRSDVEVATCLSGGLDSSSIVALLASIPEGGDIRKVFSAVFPGQPFDESAYSTVLAARYGLQHFQILPTTSSFLSDIETVVKAQEEPFGSTGVYVQWKVFEAVHEKRVKVILDGQGADEYLGGYFSFLIPYALDCLSRGRLLQAGRAIASYYNGNNFRHYLRQNFTGLVSQLFGLRVSGINSPFEQYLSPSIAHATHTAVSAETDKKPDPLAGLGIKKTLVRYLIRHSLPSLLRYEDKNSMWFSVESRVPYLDHRLVEYALRLPVDYLMDGHSTKRLLREAVTDIVPKSISSRRDKIGYGNPESEWTLALVNAGRFDVLFNEPDANNFVNVTDLKQLLSNRMQSIDPNFLWRVFNVLLWWRQQKT